MTKDIIRIAREAGLFTHKEVQPELERFAILVAAAEREACANLCEDTNQEYEPFTGQPRNLSYTCAAAIRARGTT